jgi:hypothetical protein
MLDESTRTSVRTRALLGRRGMTTQKLIELDIRETSGVDHPAHLEEGWMVMKSAGSDVTAEVERILAEAEQMHKEHSQLLAALESAKGYLNGAPDSVKAAANTLHDYLTAPEQKHEEDAAPAEETTKEAGEEARRSLAEYIVDGLKSMFAKSVGTDEAEGPADNKEVTQVAEDTQATEAVEKTTEETQAVTEEAVEETPAEAPAEEAAAEETAEAASEAGSPVDAIAETFRTELAKAVDEVKSELTAQLNAEKESHEATREALVKALERIEKLEGRTARRTSIEGQDIEKSETQNVWAGAFRGRMAAGR